MADKLASEIWQQGFQPVVCGGSAYFIKHFVYGLPQTPPCDPSVRKQIQEQLEREGKAALHAQLEKLDPFSAKRIAVNDVYRLTRALEIITITGQPLSAFKHSAKPRSSYIFLLIGLMLERKELLRRIEARVEQMFAKGLLKEFASLLEKGYSARDPALRAIGYRELFGYLDGCLSLSELKKLIVIHTRQYAKKQLTFFKSLKAVKWYKPSELEKIKEEIELFSQRHRS